MLNALRIRKKQQAATEKLCSALSAQARSEVFFRELGVADTFDGRFDLVTLHAWIVLDALHERRQSDSGRHLVDAIFVQFDEALRELGAGDIGMGRRMKKMASAFYGRLNAYGEAADEAALAQAIHRNLYRGLGDRVEAARAIATYCASARAHAAQSHLETGEVDFGPLPVPAE